MSATFVPFSESAFHFHMKYWNFMYHIDQLLGLFIFSQLIIIHYYDLSLRRTNMVKRSMKSKQSDQWKSVYRILEMQTKRNQINEKKRRKETLQCDSQSDTNGNEWRKVVFLDHIRFISHIYMYSPFYFNFFLFFFFLWLPFAHCLDA